MLEQINALLKKRRLIVFTKLKNSLYILIPLFCVCIWAFIALYKDNFTLIPAADFSPCYYAAKYIFTEPEKIYFLEGQPYPYTPFFAILFFPMGFLSFEQAHIFFFVVLLIIAELIVIIFNQILILKKLSNKFYRLLFLIAISNGIIYVQTFDTLPVRLLTAFGLIWFLKREIKYRITERNLTKNKFIFTQMMILSFAFGLTPQYTFLVLLYLFHNAKFKDFFSKFQIKRYLLFLFSFIIQNFMLIVIYLISPRAIESFIKGSSRGQRILGGDPITYSDILTQRPRDPTDGISITIRVLSQYFDLSGIQINILLFSVIIMSIITLLIHLKQNLTIENKFGLWALFSLFFYTYTYERYFVGLLPMITLLFLNYELNSDKNILNFIKKNYLILIGLLTIMILYFIPPIHYLIRVFPILMNLPIALLYLKYIYVYLILSFALYMLHKKKQKYKILIDKPADEIS